jgi:hypothetical protein
LSSCTSLSSLTFDSESELRTIGPYALSYCPSLESISLPASLESLGTLSFWNCTSLFEFVVKPGSNLTEIPTNTLYGCSKLKLIDLPASLETIDLSGLSGLRITSIVIEKHFQNVLR